MNRGSRSNYVIYEVVIDPPRRRDPERDRPRQRYPQHVMSEPTDFYDRPTNMNGFNYATSNQDFDIVYEDELGERDYQRERRRNQNQFQDDYIYHDERLVYETPYAQERQIPDPHRRRRRHQAEPEPEPEPYDLYEIEYENNLRQQARERADEESGRSQYFNQNHDSRDYYEEDDYDQGYDDDVETVQTDDDYQFDRQQPRQDDRAVPSNRDQVDSRSPQWGPYRYVSMNEYDRNHWERHYGNSNSRRY